MQANARNPEIMVLRKYGRMKHEDKIKYGQEWLRIVRYYKYVGMGTLHCAHPQYGPWRTLEHKQVII